MSSRASRRIRRVAPALVLTSVCALLPAATASAGRLVATGHDADSHCGGREKPIAQCHFFGVSVDYVRAGAPDPSKPVLVLDRGPLDVVASLNRVYGEGEVRRTVVDPRSDRFAQMPISTDDYSAIIIASSRGNAGDDTPQDLNEFSSTPDSDAILARAGALRSFFNAGGGIYVNAGGAHGDDPGDPYYAFLPITVRGSRITAPFALTDLGRAIGWTDGSGDTVDDINCCATHNAFDPPAEGSALKVAETDAAGRVVTLVADTPRFQELKDPPLTPTQVSDVATGVPSGTTCVPRKSVTLRLKRPRGIRFSRAVVYVNGRKARTLKGRNVTRTFRVRLVGRRTRVRVVITTTGKRKVTIKRTYRACA